LLNAAVNIVQALQVKGKQAAITLVVPEVNSLGVSLLGGQDLEAALAALKAGQYDSGSDCRKRFISSFTCWCG
jgi:NADH-quinone oxidoreductase subunit G